jgi:hypothetical protein
MSRARMISVPSSFATHTSVTSMHASSRPLWHSAGYPFATQLATLAWSPDFWKLFASFMLQV